MTDWTKKARCLFTKQAIQASELDGMSLLIAKHGNSFHANVQTAQDAGKPCMLFYENNPELLIQSGLNPKKWADQTNTDLQEIVKDLMVGGATGSRRAIHGVMIDCSKVMQSDGKKLTPQWITETANHLGSRVREWLGFPVWFYMDMNPILAYKDDPNSLEVLFQFILKSNGIATVDWASVSSLGYPNAAEKPALPYDDGNTWSFWFYEILTIGNLSVLSYWNQVELWKKLNFTPKPTSTGGSTNSTGGQSGGTVGLPAEVVPLLQRIAVAQERIADSLDVLSEAYYLDESKKIYEIKG